MVRVVLEASPERRQLRRDVVTRTHPLKLIAQTAYDLVTKSGFEPVRYAFTMTSIKKVGINPMSRYNTPVGIYAYPTTLEMVDKLLGGTYRNMGEKVQKDLSARPEAVNDPERALYYYQNEEDPELPFAGDQPYINFFELTDLNGVFYTSIGMSSDRYKAAIDALYAWFTGNIQDSDHLDTFKKLLTGAQQYNKVNTRGVAVQALSADISDYQRLATIWSLSRALAYFKGGQNYSSIIAGKMVGGTPAISSIWRSLLLIAGVKAVVDDAGVGLIHEAEKTQLVVLDPALIRNIAQFDNKTPARGGTVPRSAEMLKADIAGRELSKTERLGFLTTAISDANQHVLDIINGQAGPYVLRFDLTVMNSAKDLSPVRQALDIPKVIEAFRIIAEHNYKSLDRLMELTALAHGVTGSQELIDILLDHLIPSNPFTGLLQDTLPYSNSLSRSADPGRRGRFMRAVVKGYIERTKDKAADADIAASDFLINLAKSGDVSHESIGAFNLSTFIETVMPMIKSMYGDDREAIRDLMNEISIAFRSHKKFKDPEDGPTGLKKKSFEKMKAAASNIGSLMPTDDKYGNIHRALAGLVQDVQKVIEIAEDRLTDPAHIRTGSINQLLSVYNLLRWHGTMVSSINHNVGLSSPTGTALIELLNEYEATCRRIADDESDPFEILNQIKLKLGDKAFTDDGNEYSDAADDLLFDALQNHQRTRINQVKQALEKLVSGTASVLAAKQVDSKKARAEVGLYEARLRQLIRETLLSEGGLKLPPEHRRDLTPQLVSEAVAVYKQFLSGFNAWLAERGKAPIDPVRPTGSSTHAERDIVDRPTATYGDIDYLVSFPVDYTGSDLTSRRKEEAGAVREYTELLTQYLTSERPRGVDVELTLGGHPLMIIVKLPSGGLAQVDTVVTHPSYTEWMKGRYTPERGVKGYVTGNLYKALGDYFTLTIGTEGVLARIKDGKRVPSKIRAGVEYQSVSTDFTRFLRDIADYIIGRDDYEPDPLLLQHSGLDPDAPDVGDLARGIVGLARTLEAAGVADSREMLNTVLTSFLQGMEENVTRKTAREITPEQEEKMRKLNAAQGKRVEQIFRGDHK